SFVPLQSSLQDSDLAVLRAAVHRLRAQAERIQFLEQMASRSQAATPSSSSKRPAEGHGVSSESQTPASVRRLSPAGRQQGGDALRDGVAGGTQVRSSAKAEGQTAKVGVPRLPLPLPLHSEAATSAAAATDSAAATPEAPPHQQLMSLMDTQDLITQSSSSSGPCFNGNRLSKWQMDTEQVAREALQHVCEKMPPLTPLRRRGEREEGEIMSPSESEPGSRLCSWDLRPSTSYPKHRRSWSPRPEPPPRPRRFSPAVRPRRPSPHQPEKGGWDQSRDLPERDSRDANLPLFGTSSLISNVPVQFLKQLGVLFPAVFVLRFGLQTVAHALGAGDATAPALLTAILAGSSMTIWRAAEKEVDQHCMLDTSKQGVPHGDVCFHLGGPSWELASLHVTLEEAFGMALAIAHLAPVSLFENWGLHGPPGYRWAAVVAHTATAVTVTIMSYHFTLRTLR
ncbi:unnamed protein product, partial [Polarella glacialis]